MPPKATEAPVRLADLLSQPQTQERDDILLAVRVPRSLNAKVNQIAKSLRKHKTVAVQALLNEGIVAYEATVRVSQQPKGRGRPRK